MISNKVAHLCFIMVILVLLLIGTINSVILFDHAIYIDTFYTYYTNISNYFALVVFLLVFIQLFKECLKGDIKGFSNKYRSIKFQATVCSFITFLLFDCIIYFLYWRHTWFLNVSTTTFHTFCPILICLDYILFDEHFTLRVRDIFYVLFFPGIYAITTTIFCSIIPNYPPPYFFLDLNQVNFFSLLLWYFIFFCFLIFFSFIFWMWDKTYFNKDKKFRIDFKNKHNFYEYKS